MQITRSFYPGEAFGYGTEIGTWTIGYLHGGCNCSNPERWNENPEKDISLDRLFIVMQFDSTPLKQIGNRTLRKHMNHMSERIVKETIEQWEKSLFGSLKIEDYRTVNSAFSRHLLCIQEALGEIEQAAVESTKPGEHL